jgi:hypothetical protein
MAQILLIPDPRPLVDRLGRDFFLTAPERPGVYLMRDAQEAILYVGKAKNLRKRLNSYRVANPDRMARRHLRLLRQVVRIEFQECADELAALTRESELLLTLKPKFNRAGVWAGAPRFLTWRCADVSVALAITEIPAAGWRAFGPFGGGLVYLRAALARLLWYALNPTAGATTMPHGWVHGRLGEVVRINAVSEIALREIEDVVTALFDGDAAKFAAWFSGRTTDRMRAYDVDTRDSDLETIDGFIRKKARRQSNVSEAVPQTAKENPQTLLLFDAKG